MSAQPRGKVVAYVVRERGGRPELLVFTHTDFPVAGVQVPAGTIEPGEEPDDAVLRELHEETGRDGFRIVRRLGAYDYAGGSRVVRRHVYHVAVPDGLPDAWRWGEAHGTPDEIRFDFYWVSLDGVPLLARGLSDYLPALRAGTTSD